MARHSHFYCAGGFYLVSKDVAQYIAGHAQEISVLPAADYEDIAMGWWAHMAGVTNKDVSVPEAAETWCTQC